MMSLDVQDNVNLVEVPPATTARATLPGAVLVRPAAPSPSKDDHRLQTSPREFHSENDENDDDHDRSPEDGTATVLVAHLAPDEDDIRAMYQQQLANELERMRQELVPDATVVVADEVRTVVDEPTHRSSRRGVRPRLKRQIIIGILMLVVIGSGLGGVVYWVLQEDKEPVQTLTEEQQQLELLVEELRPFVAPTEEDLLPFSDPASAQSKAVAWLLQDPITLTPGRTTATVLERYALAVFSYSTSGWSSPFLSSESVCNWSGVYCTDDIVTTLDLYTPSIFIAGTFPWELILLSNITTLDFSFSQFTGVIPTRIYEHTKLEILWLEHNLFSGPLLPDFPESLTGLYLHGNDFTGTIPDVWASRLPNLRELLIYENQLTGTIPSSLGEISSLTRFEFGTNNITGSVDSFLCTGRSWVELIGDCNEVVCTCCTTCNR